MSMFAQLSISEAGRPDRTVAVADTLTIGRDNDNVIVLEAITVSRYHARLLRDETGLLLLDLESANGTLVNGVLVRPDEPVRLADGDVIQLGEVVARYAVPHPGAASFQDRAAPLAPPSRPRLVARWTATAHGLSARWIACDHQV